MRNRIPLAGLRRLALTVSMAAIGTAILSLVLAYAGREAPYTGWGFRGFPALLSLPFAVMGLVILLRHPGHGMGWNLLGIGVASSFQGLLMEYMLYSLVLFPGRLPGGVLVAWILNSFWVILILLLMQILVLFPTGKFPEPLGRKLFWVAAAILTLLGILSNLTPGKLDSSFATLKNPFALEVFAPLRTHIDDLSIGIMVFVFGLPLISLLQRFRHSKGQERQQFKWFVFAACLTLPTAAIGGASEALIFQLGFIVAMFFLLVGIAIAILRYRLYDIDLLIRRTLQYTILTALLALVYFSSVVLLQSLIENLTGEQSPIVIVLSTLAIAALFNPLRTRVQDFIDQRFYRKKYDAGQTLARFTATARDEVDMDHLNAALLQVVEETMQPESVSLWLPQRKSS